MRWSFDTRTEGGVPSQFHGEGVVGEKLVVTASDGTGAALLYGLDRGTGALVWKLAPARQVDSDLLRWGSKAIARQEDGNLFEFDLETGRTIWTLTPPLVVSEGRRDRSFPALAGDRVVSSDGAGGVLGVDAATGAVVWRRSLAEEPLGSIATHGGHVFVPTPEGRVFRLDSADGSVLAESSFRFRVAWRPVVLAEQGLVLLVSDREILATDLALEKVLWRTTAESEWTTPKPILWRGVIVAGREDGRLLGLDPQSGETVWTHEAGAPPRGLGADQELLLVGTIPGRLLALRETPAVSPPSKR